MAGLIIIGLLSPGFSVVMALCRHMVSLDIWFFSFVLPLKIFCLPLWRRQMAHIPLKISVKVQRLCYSRVVKSVGYRTRFAWV